MTIICSSSNLKRACKQVKRNKGVAGIDNMAAGDFSKWFNESGETLIEELLAERYKPQAEKQFEIPKPKGVDSCYADDFVIFVRSQKAGERVKESVIRFIKDNLQLKISEAKSKVCHIEEATFLSKIRYRNKINGF